MKWRIEATEFDDEWFVSAQLGREWVDFPMNHENSLWLGRFIKHAALLEYDKLFTGGGRPIHNAFCRVCTF